MSRKYYAHFVTEAQEMLATPDEYRGVVELRAALRPVGPARHWATVLVVPVPRPVPRRR